MEDKIKELSLITKNNNFNYNKIINIKVDDYIKELLKDNKVLKKDFR